MQWIMHLWIQSVMLLIILYSESKILNNHLSYIILRNEPKDSLINKMENHLQTRMILYALNINMENKSIWGIKTLRVDI